MKSILLKDIIQKPISGEWGLEDLYGTGIPVLRTANFTNEGIINFENVVTRNISPSKLKGKLLQKGDILLEKSGGSDRQPVGRVVYFDGQADKYGFNNFTSALRISDLTMWNPKYIFYALYANYHHGGTRKYENKTTGLHNLKVDLFIRSFSVPYATLIKQNEIVKKLDLLNHLENVCEVQLQKLDELIKSRFIEMFGHSDRPKVRLGECCLINPKKSSDIRLVDNDLMVSFVSMSDVSEDGQIVTCNHKQYESVKSGFTYFSENDVLFAKITPCMENGKGGIAKGLLNGIGFGSTEFHVLRPIDQVSNSCWLYELTSFPQFRQAAEINMTGSAGQRRVPASFLANYKVSLPPISLQNQFADFVHQLDKSKYREAIFLYLLEDVLHML